MKYLALILILCTLTSIVYGAENNLDNPLSPRTIEIDKIAPIYSYRIKHYKIHTTANQQIKRAVIDNKTYYDFTNQEKEDIFKKADIDGMSVARDRQSQSPYSLSPSSSSATVVTLFTTPTATMQVQQEVVSSLSNKIEAWSLLGIICFLASIIMMMKM
ncbi:uncharacterized protein BX663DRAFT_239887 [Cokeromyces recurvatus]|uniref:uncharacterized protein n=1 Tax=Cokeromyces recurvatus TaxID=90255 RepID=UPI002221182D|nr:uncharacterized protein BX663DRAFT_239887 [Cokeromyces recurvatus]KAI7898537.1 hypothetical protein BX663DRAFT_239887 [Cokeromyces recurvatus]